MIKSTYLEVSNDNDIGGLLEVIDIFGGLDGLSDGSGLLLEPSDDGSGVAATVVLSGLAVAEHLQGGVSANLNSK